MTEKEMAILVRVIAEEVEDLVQKKSTSGITTIVQRIRRFTKQYGENPPKI